VSGETFAKAFVAARGGASADELKQALFFEDGYQALFFEKADLFM
jgi:hypothetical protein